jgi:hypothetical protein
VRVTTGSRAEVPGKEKKTCAKRRNINNNNNFKLVYISTVATLAINSFSEKLKLQNIINGNASMTCSYSIRAYSKKVACGIVLCFRIIESTCLGPCLEISHMYVCTFVYKCMYV